MTSQTLPKGANAALADRGEVLVDLRWDLPRDDLDFVCFALGGDGRVPNDSWFLFYNQPIAPGGSIRLDPATSSHASLLLDLDQVPLHIQRCVFAATLETGSFRALSGARLIARARRAGTELSYMLADAGNEQAMIFAELYRHGTGWKLRAIGQGFAGGLAPLAEHYGVRVASETSAPLPPAPAPSPPRPAPDAAPLVLDLDPAPDPGTGTPPPRDPAPAPRPPRREDRGGRRGCLPLLGRLLKWLTILLLLALLGLAGLWYFAPQFLPKPLARLLDDVGPVASLPRPYQQPTCALADEEVFTRYHALGENYVKILERVERANDQLAELRRELSSLDAGCPETFAARNREVIEQLETLPVQGWMDEALRLNACAGLMIKTVETELRDESRPIIIQRLVRDADRRRNLESDLTNISRDLAYLRNKTTRLIEGYRENLDACVR